MNTSLPPAIASFESFESFETFAALLSGRRSIRRYQARPISDELVSRLLELATHAPSAHNRQPWRFRVVHAARERETLAAGMAGQLRLDRRADGDAEALIEADAARSQARLIGAPALILLCLCEDDMDHYPDPKRRQAETLMAVQSVAMAGQNLLLAAHAAGLGACWLCAPLFCPEIARRALNLPATWEPQGLITLGYPANAGKPFVRKTLAKVCG